MTGGSPDRENGNPYVVPTGPGYLGVATVGAGYTAAFGVGMWPVDWRGGTEVYAVVEPPGIALFASDHRPAEFITTYKVSKGWRNSPGPTLSIAGAALEVLGVEQGDDVRAYRRDGGGVLLVRAADDPFLEGVDDAE